ncbi:hypothetical protein C5142_23180 [Rhodococcus sp. BGS-1C]|jgi:hypothetical protein|uniref:hypothetical protein n=1 Tax=unclassified Rhodococcus (in: high G+C Gram-positive bacteria) TaxID=192944 RepID=UPI000965E78E|nr:hypothetical protein [Rhodococcus sp. KRD197]OLT33141.1 hypothetical protein BJF84_23810 [Rhodococcus sp. CUA-806]
MSEPSTYWQSLADAADQGHLFLNEAAAKACSQACSAYIEKLIDHQETAQSLAYIDGFGDFNSGQELRDLFAAKAVGGEDNMVDVLQSHIDVVREMQVVFKKFFDGTNAGDEDNAAGIAAQGPR